jgi:two-component system LytT family response regulator
VSSHLRALVVDDEAVARRSLVPLIEATGLAEVVGVVDRVGQALEVLRDDSVDVVFLEVRLPRGENGLDVIRGLPGERRRPLFVIATAVDREVLSGFALGVVDYLLKPVTGARIERSLQRVTAMLDPRPRDPDSGG